MCIRDSLDTAADYLDGKKDEMNEEGLRAWFGKSRSKGGKPGWVQVVSGKPCARQPGQKSTPKCVSSAKRASMSDAERKSAQRRKRKADPNQRFKSGAAKPTYVRTDSKRKMKKEDMHSDWKNEELFLYEVKDKKGKGSGSKDACYHKVKSRYSVWPSAYASGALVKCRKVGAANWGNSSKKESYDPTASFQQFQEKCWKGYEKKGMKTMFGKRYPNCVKKTKSEEVEVDTSSNVSEEFYRKKYDVKKGGYVKTDKMTKSNKRSGDSKAEYRDLHKDLAKYKIKKLETEGYSANPAQQAAIAIAKKKKKEDDMVAKKMKKEDWRSELGYVEEAKSPAWQRKAGKSESGGLNAKGVASYRAANPGSKLKTAVTTKPSKLKKGSKAANRRKSFCARMKGMKKRLTSAKTARDPNSRINKSLRKWNC